MHVRDFIRQALNTALEKEGIKEPRAQIEFPADISHGDYSSNAALQYAKQLNTSPKSLAEKLVATMAQIEGVEKVDIAGPGFINFHLSSSALATSLREAISEDMWGAGSTLSGKKIFVEYTDPNPFKEFHIGHLMSNSIGESLSRLFQFSGAEVRRANYQGDVGPHVAKAIWGYMKLDKETNILEREPNTHLGESTDKREINIWGIAYKLGSSEYEVNPQAKSEIEEINRKIYDGTDNEINSIYKEGRDASLAHFEELYAVLGTKFDHYFFESQSAGKGLDIVRANPAVFVESDGAIVYKGEDDGLHTRVFVTSKGLPTYETKELGLARMKSEAWDADISVTVTANEQTDYFRVVLAAMRKVMPEIAEKIEHVTHGMMRFAEGKMSSRTGNVITGESLLNDLIEVAKERASESRADSAENLAKQVAVAAIKYQILKQGSSKDIIFERERALSVEGDSGPYLQYAHARAHQICEKAAHENVMAQIDEAGASSDVSRLIHRFPQMIEYATGLRESHVLTNYLIQLASAFNSWYANEQILDGTAAAAHKLALTDAVRKTLKNGLWVLGIAAPERM